VTSSRSIGWAIVIAAALSVVAEAGQPEKANGPDITGAYACEGMNPDGTVYRGIVQIVRQGDAYLVLWTLPPDGRHLGIGLLSGDVLAVSYFSGGMGAIVYKVAETADGIRLDGKWTVLAAKGLTFSETLKKVPGEIHQLPPQPPADREVPKRRKIMIDRSRAEPVYRP
jgi:hypothetical protein